MATITNLQREGKMSLEYAITGRSLAFYRANEGALIVLATLTEGIISLANAYNIGKNISEEQAMDFAEALLAEHPTLKLAEFMYFIQKAKKGGYGKAFDRLDMPTIFDWLDKFFQEKDELIENKRYQEKANYEITGNRVGEQSIRSVIQDPEYQKFKAGRIIQQEIEEQKRSEAEHRPGL